MPAICRSASQVLADLPAGPGKHAMTEPARRAGYLTARADALFASDLSAHGRPGEAAVAAAISRAIRAHGSVRGCAGEVGAAYGEHPETAAPRMRWARQVIKEIYAPRG